MRDFIVINRIIMPVSVYPSNINESTNTDRQWILYLLAIAEALQHV